MKTYGIIGTGQIGTALAKALSEKLDADHLILANRTHEKALELANKLGAIAGDNEMAAQCSYIILAVKPQSMEMLLKSLRPVLQKRKDRFVLVSVAAGLNIKDLQCMAGGNYPILRIMPNTPVSIGEGMCLYVRSSELTREETEEFLSVADSAGRFDEISENLMNIGSALTGCSPAFISMFLEAMADGGVACGMPRARALEYAAQAMLGTAQLYLKTRMHPGEMKDAVCSPGGSTIAGVRALENGGFRASVISAVEAACVRGAELGKE